MSQFADYLDRLIVRLVRPRGSQQAIPVRPDLLARLLVNSVWRLVLTVLMSASILSRDSTPPPTHEQPQTQERE